MSRFWWGLPGPAAFVARVSADLRDGKSVIVRLPAWGVVGCSGALRAAYEADWRTLEPGGESVLPSDMLLARFVPEHPPTAPRDVRAVVAAERMHGHTLMLELSAASASWPAWRDFLEDYAELSRALEPFQRTVFCVVLTGAPAAALPRESVCLTHHVWRDVASPIDMDLYVAHLFQRRRARDIAQRAAAAVVARIAMWDPEVADRLAAEPNERIFEPDAVLADIARERGWSGEAANEEGWERGIHNTYDGRLRLHSAALTGVDGAEERSARVWSGQVGVLFPYLEEMRRVLLRLHGHRLRVPFDLPDNRRVSDRRDMELGHILRQLRRDRGVPRPQLAGLQTLVEMRNSLAHFETVPADTLADPDVLALERAITAEVEA